MRSADAGERPDARHLLARGLVVLEEALLDDQPLVGRHAFVVPRDAGERAFLRAIGLDVHEGRTEAQLADHLLGRRDEARAGVVGLLADGAIELRRSGRSTRESSARGSSDRESDRTGRPRRFARSAFRPRATPSAPRCRACRATRCTPSPARAARARARRPGTRRRRRSAVAENAGPTRIMVCVTLVPSVVTSVLTSRSSASEELAKRTVGTFSAASLAARSSAIFSSSGHLERIAARPASSRCR